MELEDEATGFVSSKLKIPIRPGEEKKQDQEEVEDEEEEEGGGATLSAAGTRKELQLRRVCELCGKVFRSGKALGGHMRMHSQSQPDRSRSNRSRTAIHFAATTSSRTTASNTTAVCCLCGKNFPSMKSLFGHMRSHPEREWRGIQPPPATAKTTTSPSSTLSDADDDQIADSASAAADFDYHDHRDDVDLSKSLSSWPVTTKRGRSKNIAGVLSEEQAKNEAEAVSDLLMLSRSGGGGGINKEEFDSDDDDHKDKGKGNYKPDHHVGEDYYSDSQNSQSINVMENMKRKKRRRKMKLVDLEKEEEEEEEGGGGVMVPNSNRSYTCNICNRSFPTYQALGGHRSSHNNNNNINKIMKMNMVINSHRSAASPLIEDEHHHHHRCKICNKMFPSGQALGGHKRSHWNYNVAPMLELLAHQSTSPSPGEASQASNGPKPVISFDLNELPPMEEDDNDNGDDDYNDEQVISTSSLTTLRR